MTKLTALLALLLATATACSSIDDDISPDENAGSAGGKADDLGRVTPSWIGASGTGAPARVQMARFAPARCSSGRDYSGPVSYDSWSRQRASHRNICFEVWAPGVTDWDNSEIWRDLDVRAEYRWVNADGTTTDPEWEWVDHVAWVGNNAQYGFPMGMHDPLLHIGSANCPRVPLARFDVRSDQWAFATAELLVTFTINGVTHRPSWDDGFRVAYEGFIPASCVTP